MILIWLDLETTGLSPEKDRILELAVGFASLEAPFTLSNEASWVFGLSAKAQLGLSPFIIDMHTKNGLLAECAEGVRCIVDAEDALLELVPDVEDKDDRPTLAGATVHFDLAFIRVHMPRLAKRLSHRVYDTSAIRLFCRSIGMPKPPKGEEPHRAMQDVHAIVAMAREYAAWATRART